MRKTGRLGALKDMTGWILMACALALGLMAYLMIRSYLASQEEQLKRDMLGKRPDVVKVVVATRSLSAGDVISETNVALGRLPRAHVSPRMVRAADFESVKYKVLSRAMTPGEPLLTDFLAGVVAERFSDLLQPGERAVSLEAKALDNISGMLLPGDYVDLYQVRKATSRARAARLIPVLERVKVLAAGEQPLRNSEQSFQPLSERDVQNYRQLTVGLPTIDAERLILAKETGKIVFLLRNADDLLASAVGQAEGLDSEVPAGYQYHSIGSAQGSWRPLSTTVASAKGESQEALAGRLAVLGLEPDTDTQSTGVAQTGTAPGERDE